MQLSLFCDEDSAATPIVTSSPPPALVAPKEHQLPANEPSFSVLQQQSWGGYRNEATWHTSLYVCNDADTHHAITALITTVGTLQPSKVAALFKVRQSRDLDDSDDDPVGLFGKKAPFDLVLPKHCATGDVCWNEITADFVGDHAPENHRVEDDLILWLRRCEVVGSNVVKLNLQLQPNEYRRYNECLEVLGGQWAKKKGGHVFDEDPSDLIANIIDVGSYARVDRNPLDFYPTPEEIVAMVIQYADLRPRHLVLEPSAGDGRMARMASSACPDLRFNVAELDEQRARSLRNAGFNVVASDFLAYQPGHCYDRIIMNPPFSKQADIDHVQHAWSLLVPGGIVVAIMPASITFRGNKKTAAFRDLVGQYGELFELPSGSFKESNTMVNTVIVVLRKPA